MKKRDAFSPLVATVLLALSSMGLSSCGNPGTAEPPHLNLVPYPKTLVLSGGDYRFSAESLTISLPDSLTAMHAVMQRDFQVLAGKNTVLGDSEPNISVEMDDAFGSSRYALSIQNTIRIKAGTYRSALMAWTTLMQLASSADGIVTLPKCTIDDAPDLAYRGLLLDVARKFQSIQSIKHTIDACRWYKIDHLQLHLNDDDLFVFPSAAFPKLATVGKSYTKEELIDLVEYARLRGVTLVPEFDAPAHTGSLRKAYPELFGAPELRMLDVANEKVIDACKTIAGEMMEVFSTSPYFHIGADEVNLERFSALPTTTKAVAAKGFDSPYDLYLDYIVKLHGFVKGKGLKTLIWEGFEGQGSDKVKIPTDIIVFAWESYYQRPDSLVANGYTIVNASWKPIYMTPARRWTQAEILGWNSARWENFHSWIPSFNPIQLEGGDREKILGVQMCAWEMTEEMNLPAILHRLPAVSERAWTTGGRIDHDTFAPRYAASDEKLNRLLFPARMLKEGLTHGKMHERFYNLENHFAERLNVDVVPEQEGVSVRYTTDGTVPDLDSPVFDGPITMDTTTLLRVSLYRQGTRIGYRSELFEKRPVALRFSGHAANLENPVDGTERFTDTVQVTVHRINPNVTARYTVDGAIPTSASTSLGPSAVFTETTELKIQCFDEAGKPDGEAYHIRLVKNSKP